MNDDLDSLGLAVVVVACTYLVGLVSGVALTLLSTP